MRRERGRERTMSRSRYMTMPKRGEKKIAVNYARHEALHAARTKWEKQRRRKNEDWEKKRWVRIE